MIKPAAIPILVIVAIAQIVGVVHLYRLYKRHVHFYKNARIVDGIVIETRKFSSGDGPDYFARVSYTVAATEYFLKDGIWTQSRRYKRGQRVEIYYPSDSPGSGRIGQPLLPALYLGGAFLIAASAVLLFAGLLSGLMELQWLP